MNPGDERIAWDAIAFQPLAAKPKHQVVALGDSYASGEGATGEDTWDYYPESDKYGEDPMRRNACHRSKHAWSRQAVMPDSATPIGQRADSWNTSMDFHLLACSGALVKNLLPSSLPAGPPPTDADGFPAEGRFREPSQMDKGFLDSNTTLVTLSIGGNDARFADILKYCAETFGDCHDDVLPGDPEPLESYEPKLMRGKIMESVRRTIGSIRALAPNARIVLMGYPVTVQVESINQNPCYDIFGGPDIEWFRAITIEFNEYYEDLGSELKAAGIPIEFVNPVERFDGRGACATDSLIHGLVWRKSAGDEPGIAPSQQSFHPKIAGNAVYAELLSAALRN